MRLLFVIVLVLAACAAHAELRVRVAATDPPAEATLGRDQSFYVRIQHDADEPTAFWTHAYAAGLALIVVLAVVRRFTGAGARAA